MHIYKYAKKIRKKIILLIELVFLPNHEFFAFESEFLRKNKRLVLSWDVTSQKYLIAGLLMSCLLMINFEKFCSTPRFFDDTEAWTTLI